jgi:trimeric autotransporter adhesin
MSARHLVYLFCSTLLCLVASKVQAGPLVALTQSNSLISFDSSNPGSTSAPVSITGLMMGDVLAGIDYRPSNGVVYGFASTGGVGRVYSINTLTGAALLSSTLNQTVTGSFYGVDFNPVADRLRIIGDDGQSLRVNVDTGLTLVDGALNYAMMDPNNGTTPFVVASAYTNSVAGATSTTLYNIDTATQSLVTQIPPNSGTLNTIGSLSDFAFAESAFDIEGGTNNGFVVFNGADLLSINLSSGMTSFIGSINSGSAIVDITAVPEPGTLVVLGAVGAAGVANRMRRRRKLNQVESSSEGMQA